MKLEEFLKTNPSFHVVGRFNGRLFILNTRSNMVSIYQQESPYPRRKGKPTLTEGEQGWYYTSIISNYDFETVVLHSTNARKSLNKTLELECERSVFMPTRREVNRARTQLELLFNKDSE